jgi:hypothetical protein
VVKLFACMGASSSAQGECRIFYEGTLSGQNRLLEALAELLRTGAEIVGSGTTRKRFEEMASFYEVTRHVIKATLDQRSEGGLG